MTEEEVRKWVEYEQGKVAPDHVEGDEKCKCWTCIAKRLGEPERAHSHLETRLDGL